MYSLGGGVVRTVGAMTTFDLPSIAVPAVDLLLEGVANIAAGLRVTAPGFDRSGELDVAGFARLRAAGVTGALVPLQFGGGGVSHAEMGEILRVLGASDPAVAVTLASN